MNRDAFFTLHRDLPREGPGEPADVLWALDLAETPMVSRICDAACGPGADLPTLAEARPEARIEGVEQVPHFVAEASAKAGRFPGRVTVIQGDMKGVSGPYDLIWCAGALYFTGIAEGLRIWRDALAPGGKVAFSDAVWLSDTRDPVLVDFWAQYPAMTDVAGTRVRAKEAGYKVLGERILSDAAWENYYTPMMERTDTLRAGQVSVDVAEVLEEGEREAMIWRQYRRDFGYVLMVVAPV